MFSNNDKLYIPISGGTGWTKVPMNSNYPSQELGKDGNMYAPVSEVNKPRVSAPIISNTNTSIVQDSRAYNPTSLYVDGLYNSTPESRMNYYIRQEQQEKEEAKRQQEALITANINKALDIAASTQYRIMDKLYIEGGLDAMRKEYYRLSAGTEGYNSVYARAAYNSLCAKDKEEVPIREVTTNAANKYYNEGGIEGLKHLINYYKSNGYFNYASVAQSILSTKEKEEITHTPEVTKGANHYYETGGIERLRHLVKYYGENNYPVYANIAKRILKEKEEQEHEKSKQDFDKAIQEAERILKLNNIDIPREKVIKIFNEHPDLKVSEKGIEDSLVKLGWVGGKETGVPTDRKDAFIRGVQQFVYNNREEFIKNSAGYSELLTDNQITKPGNIVQKIKDINESFEARKPRDIADIADDILHKRCGYDANDSNLLESAFDGIEEAFVETGEFIGEEVARLHLGEKTETGQKIDDIKVFFEEEKQCFDTGKTTKTGQALKNFGSYLKKEGELVVSHEKTQAEQFVRDAYRKIKDTPSEKIAHGLGKFGGEMLIGYGVFKGTTTLVKGTGKVVNAVKTSKRSASLAEVKLVKESLLKEKTLNNPKPIVTQYNNHNANNVNAQKALNKKMRALQDAQKDAVKIIELSDGRIRYYERERFAYTPGPTKGSSFVTEYNPKTGHVRQWNENYDQFGNVNRIHPKTIDGKDIVGQHYPPTQSELQSFLSTKRLGEM